MNLTIIFRIIIFYLFIIIAYRLINKQDLKELTIADGIIFIITIQLIIEVLFHNNQNMLLVIIPILVLIFLKPLINFFNTDKIRSNNIIIKNGKINFSEINKIKYSIQNLMEELSNQGINKIEDVKLAYFNNSELIIEQFYKPIPIIFNGIIDYQTLYDIDKNQEWLNNILKTKKLKIENIYYSFYIDERLYIIQKEL